MSEFERVEIVLKAALLPSSTRYPLEAVKRQLNAMLFRYNEDVGGVPITFSQLKFIKGKEYGRILAEQHWLHVDVTTKLLVFKPEAKMLLIGTVMKISDSHVALLIHGMFNASISGDQMRKSYNFDEVSNTWGNNSSVVSQGDKFEFIVENYQHAHGVLNIDGAVP